MKKAMVLCLVIAVIGGISGAGQETSVDVIVPGALSLGIPGLGHFFLDEIDTGIFHLGVAIGLWAGSRLIPADMRDFYRIAPLVWHLYSGYDAYSKARAMNFRFGIVDGGLGFGFSF